MCHLFIRVAVSMALSFFHRHTELVEVAGVAQEKTIVLRFTAGCFDKLNMTKCTKNGEHLKDARRF